MNHETINFSSSKVALFDERMPENQGDWRETNHVTPIYINVYHTYMAENLSKLVRIHPAAILSFSVSYQAKFYCGSLDGNGKLEAITASQPQVSCI